jgi:hypothetical protein
MYFIDSRKQKVWTRSLIGNFIIENIGLLRVYRQDNKEITSFLKAFNSKLELFQKIWHKKSLIINYKARLKK